MSHLFGWTILCFAIYLVLRNDNINCQYFNPNEGCAPSTAELISTLVKELSPAGRSQLVNALLSAASDNGILPELTSFVQPSQPIDSYAAATINSAPQAANVVPIVANIPTVCRSDPRPCNTPLINPSIDALYCVGIPQSPAPFESFTQNDFPTYTNTPQLVYPQALPSLSDIVYSICTPTYIAPDTSYQIPPSSPPPSYPSSFTSSSSSSSSSPSSSSLSSSSSSSSSSTNSPNNIPSPSYVTSSITTTPSPSPSIPSSSASCLLFSSSPSPIKSPQLDYVEPSPTIGSRPNSFSSYYTTDSEFPVNLEINIPALSVPEPRITIVSTERPAPHPVAKKSSSLKKILPLLLIAMLCNERNNNACCCKCNSPNIVPIPYPVPMPICSPVFCYSCGNDIDDNDDDDDKQKKGNRKRREDQGVWEEPIENKVQ